MADVVTEPDTILFQSTTNGNLVIILIHLLPKKTSYSSLPPEGELFLSIVNV